MRTDAELVRASRDGDRAAFGLLIDRHQARATAIARGMLSSRKDVDDVVQEALLQAYLGLKRLRDPAAFGSWLCGIVANLARMRLRGDRHEAVPLDAGGRVVPEASQC